ncbi:MAG: hypothetical protein GXO68_00510 [Crenarchaeota archaeon]|nr:hypothetical protein [Thermoproteota archaeon]
MPERRTHIKYDILLAEKYNLNVTIEDITLIETIIDHPNRLPNTLKKVFQECNIHPSLNASLAGFHIKGVMRHDWNSSLGRELLYKLLSCLFGEDALLIAELHFALDSIWENRPIGDISPLVKSFLEDMGLL